MKDLPLGYVYVQVFQVLNVSFVQKILYSAYD